MKRLIFAVWLLFAATAMAADSALQVDFLLSGFVNPLTKKPPTNGYVLTYLDGTSTLSALWTDSGKGGTAANPIVLDTGGKAEVYGDGVYKFEIYDGDPFTGGTLLETINGLNYKVDQYVNVEYLSQYDSFSDAITAIGSSETTLIIDKPFTLTENTLIPDTLSLEWRNGCVVSGGYTLTINGSLQAGLYKLFDSSVNVISIHKAYPEWWGAVGDGITNDVLQMKAACSGCSKHLILTSNYMINPTSKNEIISPKGGLTIDFVGDSSITHSQYGYPTFVVTEDNDDVIFVNPKIYFSGTATDDTVYDTYQEILEALGMTVPTGYLGGRRGLITEIFIAGADNCEIRNPIIESANPGEHLKGNYCGIAVYYKADGSTADSNRITGLTILNDLVQGILASGQNNFYVEDIVSHRSDEYTGELTNSATGHLLYITDREVSTNVSIGNITDLGRLNSTLSTNGHSVKVRNVRYCSIANIYSRREFGALFLANVEVFNTNLDFQHIGPYGYNTTQSPITVINGGAETSNNKISISGKIQMDDIDIPVITSYDNDSIENLFLDLYIKRGIDNLDTVALVQAECNNSTIKLLLDLTGNSTKSTVSFSAASLPENNNIYITNIGETEQSRISNTSGGSNNIAFITQNAIYDTGMRFDNYLNDNLKVVFGDSCGYRDEFDGATSYSKDIQLPSYGIWEISFSAGRSTRDAESTAIYNVIWTDVQNTQEQIGSTLSTGTFSSNLSLSINTSGLVSMTYDTTTTATGIFRVTAKKKHWLY